MNSNEALSRRSYKGDEKEQHLYLKRADFENFRSFRFLKIKNCHYENFSIFCRWFNERWAIDCGRGVGFGQSGTLNFDEIAISATPRATRKTFSARFADLSPRMWLASGLPVFVEDMLCSVNIMDVARYIGY